MGLGDALYGLFVNDPRKNMPPMEKPSMPFNPQEQQSEYESTQLAPRNFNRSPGALTEQDGLRVQLEQNIRYANHVFDQTRHIVYKLPTYSLELNLASITGQVEMRWVFHPQTLGRVQLKIFRTTGGFPSERAYDTEGMEEIVTTMSDNRKVLQYEFGSHTQHIAMVYPREIGSCLEPMDLARFTVYMPTHQEFDLLKQAHLEYNQVSPPPLPQKQADPAVQPKSAAERQIEKLQALDAEEEKFRSHYDGQRDKAQQITNDSEREERLRAINQEWAVKQNEFQQRRSRIK